MKKSDMIFYGICLIFGIINFKVQGGILYSAFALSVAAIITVLVKNKYKIK